MEIVCSETSTGMTGADPLSAVEYSIAARPGGGACVVEPWNGHDADACLWSFSASAGGGDELCAAR